MKVIRTDIPDLIIIEPTIYEDDRGWFLESFNEKRFHNALTTLYLPIPSRFVQDNHSCSKRGVLRGLHYQTEPHAQGKLVQVSQGAVYDVAVDLRRESPTFGKWVGVELNSRNKHMLWIPEGFAHGFVALEDDTHFHYKTTNYYAKDCEAAIRWSDPILAINWPDAFPLIINAKDSDAPLFSLSTVSDNEFN